MATVFSFALRETLAQVNIILPARVIRLEKFTNLFQ
jgi:hypothetical protein